MLGTFKDYRKKRPKKVVKNKMRTESPKTREWVNAELQINLSQTQYDELAILDACTPKYTAYEILKLLKTLGLLPTKTPNQVCDE